MLEAGGTNEIIELVKRILSSLCVFDNELFQLLLSVFCAEHKCLESFTYLFLLNLL